jgi:pimeloyl-ACP methyl ester carboxylesterase
MSNDRVFERSKMRVRFKNDDFDFVFQWALGYGVYGGLTHGELFAIAARIEDGNPDSWVTPFYLAGDRLRHAAEQLLASGKKRSAGETYLKAFCAYRFGCQFLSVKDARFVPGLSAFKACFRAAMEQLELPCEAIEVPFAAKHLPGYWLKIGGDPQPRPTLIVIGGGDSYCEDLYFFAGAAARSHGYQALMVDLPGQGDTPLNDLYFGIEPERTVTAIVDWASARPEVDLKRLAMIGFSGGGFFAPRAAAYEKRIQALIADAIMFDMGAVLDAELPAVVRQGPGSLGKALIKVVGSVNKVVQVSMEKYCWQGGVANPLEFLELARRGQVDVSLIDCPTLCLVGEGDPPEVLRQHRMAFEQLRSPRKAQRIFTIEEGADAHCQVNNFPLLHQVVFDWLDDVLA